MPQFAANLSMMYTEHAFLERFAAAAYDGFKAVEYLFPYDFATEDIRARLEAVVGGEVRGGSPEEMRGMLADQVSRWTRVVREAKIKAE